MPQASGKNREICPISHQLHNHQFEGKPLSRERPPLGGIDVGVTPWSPCRSETIKREEIIGGETGRVIGEVEEDDGREATKGGGGEEIAGEKWDPEKTSKSIVTIDTWDRAINDFEVGELRSQASKNRREAKIIGAFSGVRETGIQTAELYYQDMKNAGFEFAELEAMIEEMKVKLAERNKKWGLN